MEGYIDYRGPGRQIILDSMPLGTVIRSHKGEYFVKRVDEWIWTHRDSTARHPRDFGWKIIYQAPEYVCKIGVI